MTKEQEEYKQSCDDILISRAKDTSVRVCVSGEDVDGVHMKYSREYLGWNLHCMLFRIRVEKGLNTQQEFDSWLITNPEPKVKFI